MTKHHIKPAFNVLAVFVLALAMTLQAFFVPNASAAAQITNRKLTLQAGSGGDGGAKVSGVVNHFFEFTIPTTGTALGSIKFQYCTTAAPSAAVPGCVMPAGLDTTLAGTALGSEAGSGATGFTLNKTTNGSPYLTRTSSNPSNGTMLLRLDNVQNPNTEGSFFVRISTYSSTDTTGTSIDEGTVTASTNEQIILSGTMPESLVFCAGADIAETGGVPDCSTATSGVISFNQLFSPTDTASAISEMAASTNAGFGYAITVNGPTLTSGANTIAGMASPAASNVGIAQFGLNLVANTVLAAPGFDPGAPVGILTPSADIDQTSNGTNFKGQPTADYITPNTFKFVTGNTIANSAYDGTTNTTLGPTDAQIYTVSYIANVPGSQPAGTYTSTLTYICTPTF